MSDWSLCVFHYSVTCEDRPCPLSALHPLSCSPAFCYKVWTTQCDLHLCVLCALLVVIVMFWAVSHIVSSCKCHSLPLSMGNSHSPSWGSSQCCLLGPQTDCGKRHVLCLRQTQEGVSAGDKMTQSWRQVVWFPQAKVTKLSGIYSACEEDGC